MNHSAAEIGSRSWRQGTTHTDLWYIIPQDSNRCQTRKV